jgi:lysophospholipase L1-like esterase
MCLLIPNFSDLNVILNMKITLLLLSLVFTSSAFAQTKTYDTLPNMPEHYVARYQLFQKEPVATGRIIMVGNSITEGTNWKVLLKDTTVINRGISGDVTFGVLNRLKEITDRKPSKLFLLIGVNDLSRNTPDEVIIENIFNIVGKIHSQSPATAIYVQSILPTNDSNKNLHKAFSGKGEHVKTINAQLKKYAEKLKYTYVDLYSTFLDADGRMDSKFTYDGLHLNATGYDHWIEILKKEKYL